VVEVYVSENDWEIWMNISDVLNVMHVVLSSSHNLIIKFEVEEQ
jgi:hypothetical protein